MNVPSPSDIETQIQALRAAGDYEAATTLTLRTYGPELLALLKLRLHDLQEARDAFAWLAEDLWRGMPGFRGDSSLRTWSYAVARNVVRRYVDRELRARLQAIPLSQVSRESALSVPLAVPDPSLERITRLRAQLTADEQDLLTLRIDKGMDYRDVALVMLYDGKAPTDVELSREAARLRKRFQILKAKLRKLVEEEEV